MDYIGRKAWGAQHVAGAGARELPCAEAWLHHTVTLAPDLAFSDLNADSLDDDEVRAMRRIESIGQQRFGRGFSYNLAVMPSGRVYVGCGVRRVGTHTGGRNTRALGIVLVGDYSKHEPSPQMSDALVEVLRDAKRLGWLRDARLSGGHRDVKATGCPGDRAYRLIADVNRRAAGAVPSPAPTPEPITTRGPSMIIVLHPDGRRQYLCDRTGADHIGGPERELLVAEGVPYAGPEHPETARAELLRRRGVDT